MAFLSGFGIRKLKTVSGSTAGAQTDYSLQINLFKAGGVDTNTNVYLNNNCKNDFSDIRFTTSDGTTLLGYWIETLTVGVSATIWVKIDSIPASPAATIIYIYYNNPLATSLSNGSNAFLEFCKDDINTVTTYSSNPGGSVAIVNNQIKFTLTNSAGTSIGISSKFPTTQKKILIQFNIVSITGNLWPYIYMWRAVGPYGYYGVRTQPSPFTNVWRISNNGVDTTIGAPGYNFVGIWHFKRSNTTYTTGFNGVDSGGSTTVDNLGNEPYVFMFYAGNPMIASTAGTIILDYIRMRALVSPEPTFGSTGNEELNITAIEPFTLSTNTCIGPCSITAGVTWQNLGNGSITFTPAISIDGTYLAYGTNITIPAGGTGSSLITTPILSIGSHIICPYPN